MQTRFVRCALVVMAAALPVTTGCTTAAKQALQEVRGAHADLLFNQDVGKRVLARFEELRFNPPTTTLSTKLCPPRLLRAYERNARELTVELAELYPGGKPLLTIDSEMQFFRKKGLLNRAELLMRVKMHNEQGLIADALVIASSKAFRAGGEEHLTEAALEAIGEFLRKQKTPPADEN